MQIQEISEQVQGQAALIQQTRDEISKVIIGQDQLIDRLLTALLCNNHVLIEGLPGLAKTLAVTTLAQATGTDFKRIQFTPDLLPGDLLGTLIYNPKSGEFTVKKGPLFANLILADEINRAPAKVQSALLEAMQERQITIGDTSFSLEEPFMVLATQNPVEQEGTYPLPEAQVDRFMFKLKVDYPSKAEELAIMRARSINPTDQVTPVISPADILALRRLTTTIYLDPTLEEYIVNLVDATRNPGHYKLDIGPFIQFGASPRATIFLAQAARGTALLAGRGYVTPQDIKTIALDVLRHRLLLTYEAEAEEISSDELIGRLLATVEVP
ncbi:MAG: MoxR family ATPase [Proteobacteria bacterium]|nr:MoxR family ATPase [Pseudomonadota bacterium]MBU1639741.1 MoxR family ATPase [Pseudomonadota bacterium]